MLKKISIILALIISFLGVSLSFNKQNVKVFANEQTQAKSMVVLELNSNRVLLSKDMNKKVANASTTKIATFLTVLKNCKNFKELVKIDDRAIGIPGTSLYLKQGETLTVEELLYGMMLISGNDAATALALHISKSVEDFAILMTKEAKKCGAKNTNFKNPHGLDDKEHYTTAFDLALITKECYKYPLFEKIVSTKNIKILNRQTDSFRYLKNKNKLLWNLDNCVGVKTGYTKQAGRCLVSSVKQDDMHLICVVLNCGPMFEESIKHFNFVLDNYKMTTILCPYSYLKTINVLNADKKDVKLFTKRGFKYPLTKDEELNIKVKNNIKSNVKAPLKKEEVVGKIEIYLSNHLLFSENIYTMESVKSNRIEDNIKSIISKW